jgi:hypothetical protein
MSYIINKTDGSELTTIIDGTFDQTATDLTLIGKNTSTYGEVFNENFVHLLENFANNNAPTKPIAGQLWFDTNENRLKVYDGNLFKVSGGTIVSVLPPNNPVAGDLWINPGTQQLKFYDGAIWILTGPVYTSDQGVSGVVVTNVVDTLNRSQTVTEFWCAGTLIGIFSATAFTPLSNQYDPSVFAGSVSPGFNLGSTTGLLFKTEVETASKIKSQSAVIAGNFIVGTEYIITLSGTTNFTLIGASSSEVGVKFIATGVGSGTGRAIPYLTSDNLIQTTGNSVINQGTLSIQSDIPLILGTGQNNEIRVNESSFDIVGNNSGQNFSVKLKPVSGSPKGIFLYNPGTFVLLTTAATGNGTTATLTFAQQVVPPFAVGDIIDVKLIIPEGYQGTYEVTSCTKTTVSFLNTTTQNQSAAGTIELVIDPRFGILLDENNVPTAPLDVNGNAVIRGNLTVLGDTTTVYTQTISVEDKNIELGVPSENISPTDATNAANGGLILKGTTDKTFTWNYASGTAINQYWNSSESINIASGKTFKIDGVDVLTATTLGVNITSAPGINSLGTLTSLDVGDVSISGNTISVASGDLILSTSGLNTVDVDGQRITSLANPASGTDAVNRNSMYSYVTSRSLGMTVSTNNTSGGELTNNEIAGLVQEVYPASEYANLTVCRVHCTFTTVSFNAIPIVISDTDPAANIAKSFVTVNKGVGTENSSVLQDISALNDVDAGNGLVTNTRTLKTYSVQGGVWTFVSSAASSVIA